MHYSTSLLSSVIVVVELQWFFFLKKKTKKQPPDLLAKYKLSPPMNVSHANSDTART